MKKNVVLTKNMLFAEFRRQGLLCKKSMIEREPYLSALLIIICT